MEGPCQWGVPVATARAGTMTGQDKRGEVRSWGVKAKECLCSGSGWEDGQRDLPHSGPAHGGGGGWR